MKCIGRSWVFMVFFYFVLFCVCVCGCVWLFAFVQSREVMRIKGFMTCPSFRLVMVGWMRREDFNLQLGLGARELSYHLTLTLPEELAGPMRPDGLDREPNAHSQMPP